MTGCTNFLSAVAHCCGPLERAVSVFITCMFKPDFACTFSVHVGCSLCAGKSMMRQQLQQQLRYQAHQLRSFGDYLRRNLKTLVELLAVPGSHATVNATQLDGLRFLISAPMSRQGGRGLGEALCRN